MQVLVAACGLFWMGAGKLLVVACGIQFPEQKSNPSLLCIESKEFYIMDQQGIAHLFYIEEFFNLFSWIRSQLWPVDLLLRLSLAVACGF